MGLGHGRARHPTQFLVQFEVVLQRNRCQCLGLFLDSDSLFGLHRLVQAVAPLTPVLQPAGEFIDNNDLAILDDVVDIAFVEIVRL